MTYEMRYPKSAVARCGWVDPTCIPAKDSMASMYEAGMVLYVDGKAKTLKQALTIAPVKAPKHDMITERKETIEDETRERRARKIR